MVTPGVDQRDFKAMTQTLIWGQVDVPTKDYEFDGPRQLTKTVDCVVAEVEQAEKKVL